jgi:flagellar hook-basal body complex protein FliE
MSDPLGLVNARAGLPGVGAGGVGAAGGGGSGPGASGVAGASFKDALLANLNQVNQLQQEATTATEDLVTGKRNDLEGVLLATQKADSAFRMLLAVRNKVQAAYDEVKQVRI